MKQWLERDIRKGIYAVSFLVYASNVSGISPFTRESMKMKEKMRDNILQNGFIGPSAPHSPHTHFSVHCPLPTVGSARPHSGPRLPSNPRASLWLPIMPWVIFPSQNLSVLLPLLSIFCHVNKIKQCKCIYLEPVSSKWE